MQEIMLRKTLSKIIVFNHFATYFIDKIPTHFFFMLRSQGNITR